MNHNKQERIRIKLKSFNSKLLDKACETIKEKIIDKEATILGPIRLPNKKRIYCVLRSPHVNKKSREHFEIRMYKRIIDIYPNEKTTASSLIGINLPAGVDTTVIF